MYIRTELDAAFLEMDLIEDVEYQPYTGDTFGVAVPTKAYGAAPSRKAQGAVTNIEKVWHLRSNFGAIQVAQGGRIKRLSDGTTWIVQACAHESAETRWRCDCIREVG